MAYKLFESDAAESPRRLLGALGPLDLEHNPGFLVGRISRRMSAEMDRRLREHGVTFAQGALLARLWLRDGLTQSELLEQVGLDASTLTGLLQRMTRQGLVRRRRDQADGRVLRVYLTSRARELRPVLSPEAEAVNERFFRGLSPGERAMLVHLLHRGLANLESDERRGE